LIYRVLKKSEILIKFGSVMWKQFRRTCCLLFALNIVYIELWLIFLKLKTNYKLLLWLMPTAFVIFLLHPSHLLLVHKDSWGKTLSNLTLSWGRIYGASEFFRRACNSDCSRYTLVFIENNYRAFVSLASSLTALWYSIRTRFHLSFSFCKNSRIPSIGNKLTSPVCDPFSAPKCWSRNSTNEWLLLINDCESFIAGSALFYLTYN
jgi:hypothetical protein